jgi:hypothetical protein
MTDLAHAPVSSLGEAKQQFESHMDKVSKSDVKTSAEEENSLALVEQSKPY